MSKINESGGIRIPSTWFKLVPLIVAALAGGGGGSWLSSERVAVLEIKVAVLERDNETRREWMVKLTDRIRELEHNNGDTE